MKESVTVLRNDRSHQNPKAKHIVRFPRLIRRFPRRTAEDVAFYRTAYRIADLETQAREWIGRGRDANTELGRIFIRLKGLVGHRNFEKYYIAKFGRPYNIAFRTAQSYMRLAREADEKAKSARPAPYPLATDQHAVAIREAAERARQAVAGAAEDSSSDSASNDAETAANSICIFRPYIRMTREQRDTVAQLWKSKHRKSVDSDVTDYMLRLCKKYDVFRSDSKDSDD